jgi:excisionase family DNA binding protein
MVIPRLLSVADVAEQFGVSESTLYRWIYLRRIPFRKIGGRVWFTEPDLVEWMEARKVLVTPSLGGSASTRTLRSHADECAALGIEPNHRFS